MDLMAIGIANQNSRKQGFSYNTDIGLRNWRAALANLSSGGLVNYDVIVQGDSISEGEGFTPVSDWLTKSFVGVLRTKMQTLFGDTGTGFIPVNFPNNQPTLYWTLTGAWNTGNAQGFGLNTAGLSSNVVGETASITFNGTGVGILVTGGSWGGQFTAKIDAGAPTTFNSVTGGSNLGTLWNITGLTTGVHTLLITVVSGTIALNGILPTTATNGVRVNMMGKYGLSVGQVLHGNSLNNIIAMNSKLTIIALTANDYGNQIPLDSYASYLQAGITQALSTGDCLLTSVGVHSDDTVLAIKQASYVSVMKQLALSNNCAYLDIASRWGSGTIAKNTLGFLYDNVHPTKAGHQDIANAIYNVLMS